MLTYYYGETQGLTIKLNRINRSVYQLRILEPFDELNSYLTHQIQEDILSIFDECDLEKSVDRRWLRLNKPKLKKILRQTQKMSLSSFYASSGDKSLGYV